jgi:hypothetical protein
MLGTDLKRCHHHGFWLPPGSAAAAGRDDRVQALRPFVEDGQAPGYVTFHRAETGDGCCPDGRPGLFGFSGRRPHPLMGPARSGSMGGTMDEAHP